MASHGEINPSDIDLLFGTSLNALEIANGLLTRRSGDVWIDTGDGKGVLAGAGAADGINRVDGDGNQSPLVDTSGIDKAARDARKAADDAAAKADDAIRQGEQIRQDAQAGIDDARRQAQDAAAKADKARSDLQAEVDANRKAADTAIAAVDAKADKARSDLESQTTALKEGIAEVDAKTDQIKAAADKLSQRVDADKAALDKSIADVDAKAQAVSDKGDRLAGRISDVTTTVNGHTTKLGELSTRIEGVASDGQATVKSLTDLRQTVTGLSSTVSQNTKTASDAMSKVSQVEQTANGISATLSKNYTSTADADKKYAAKTELKATADGLQAAITKSQQTADGAVTAANRAQATADGFGATLSKDYRTAKDSDLKYSTKAELKATSDGLSSSLSSVKSTADGAVTAASKAQQTADAVSLNLSKNYATKSQADATYATKTSLKVTSDSLTASISSTAKTAQSAVDKATGLEQNLDGFKTTVSQTYTTKADFDKLSIGGTNRAVLTGSKPGRIDAGGKFGFDAAKNDHCYTPLVPATPDASYTVSDSMATPDTGYVSVAFYDQGGKFLNRPLGAFQSKTAPWTRTFSSPANAAQMAISFPVSHKGRIKLEKGTKATDWSPAPEDLQAAGDYATASSVEQTADSIRAQVTETAKTAAGAMDKATTLEQTANSLSTTITAQGKTLDATTKTANEAKSTADSNKQTISQVKTTADGAVNRVSGLEQNLSGFKQTVSETYTTKSDFDRLSIGSRNFLLHTKDWSSNWNGTHADDGTYLGFKVRKSTTVDDFASQTVGDRFFEPDTDYVLSFYARAEKNRTILCYWYPQYNASDTYTDLKKQVSITTQWKRYSVQWHTAVRQSNSSILFKVLQASSTGWAEICGVKLEKGTKPTDWSPAPEDLQPAGDYATHSELTQTANSIKVQVTEVSKTASGAMSKATSLEQTANGLSTRITEQAKTLDATVKTANEVKSTAESNKTTISRTANLVNAALAGDNLITDGGFESTTWWAGLPSPWRISNGAFYHGAHVLVGDAATSSSPVCPLIHSQGQSSKSTAIAVTRGRTYRLSGYSAWLNSVPSNVNVYAEKLRLCKSDGTYITDAKTGNSTAWTYTFVDWKCPDDGSITSVMINVMHQSNGTILWDDVSFQDITEAAATSTRVASVEQNLDGFKTTVADTYQPKSGMGGYATQSQLTQTANQIRGEVSEKYQSKDGMGSYATNSALTQKANEITGKVQEVAKTTQGNTTTISQVSQKADRINTTLSQQIDGKADVSRVSSLEQNLSGFKTTVAQSYQPKGDYPTRSDMQSSISQTASSIKSEVANTYTTQTATEALRKSATRTFTLTGANGKAKWVKLGYLTSNGDSSSVLLHVYSGNGFNGWASQNAEFEIFVKDGAQQSPSATGAFGVSVSRIRGADDVKVKVMAFSSTTCDIWAYMPWTYWNGHYTLQGDYESWQDGPNCGGVRIQDAEPTSGTAQNLAYDTLSTRSYVDQTAKSVALGVVQSYKGSDGSGLATKSDITAAKDSITSTVSKTYATKDGVTQEIGSKITQNNSSWEARFYSKTETDSKVSAVAKTSMTGVRVEYALAASSTTAPTSGWSTTAPAWQSGRYMWQRTVTTLGDGTSKTTAATCITGATGQTGPKGATGSTGPQGPQGATGKQGQTGATGNGAKSITPEYYLSTSATTQTGGSWSPNMAWSSGKYLWTRSKCVWTNGTTTTTTPVLADALNNANSTANQAASKAQNAQDRVAALEPCIQMTSDGVQVGKKTNGVFTGPSALVGTDGVFHVKNKNPANQITDVVQLGQDKMVVKSNIARSGGDFLDRFIMGPFGDDHFAIRMEPLLDGSGSASSEPEQLWQTGWQNITTGKGCEVYGHASYGYRGGCLRFRGRVKTTIDGDNSLFANPGVLNLWVSSMNRNFLLPAYRNNTLGWTNAYIPANSRQVRINGVWDWVSLDQLSIAQ